MSLDTQLAHVAMSSTPPTHEKGMATTIQPTPRTPHASVSRNGGTPPALGQRHREITMPPYAARPNTAKTAHPMGMHQGPFRSRAPSPPLRHTSRAASPGMPTGGTNQPHLIGLAHAHQHRHQNTLDIYGNVWPPSGTPRPHERRRHQKRRVPPGSGHLTGTTEGDHSVREIFFFVKSGRIGTWKTITWNRASYEKLELEDISNKIM